MNNYLRTALFRNNQPLSCTKVSSVDGFEIEGAQPVNTDRRIVFSYHDGSSSNAKYYRLDSTNGVAQVREVCESGFNAAKVLSEGNTVEELKRITSIPDWLNRDVYPIVALSAPESQSAIPTIRIGIKTTPLVPQYEKVEESPVYEMSDTDIPIIGVSSSEIEKSGTGVLTIQARFKTDGIWSDYIDIRNISNVKASAVQFRVTYSVSAFDDSSSAKVDKIWLVYSNGNSKVSGESTELVLMTKKLESGEAEEGKGLSYGQCLICHEKLQDAEIKAYVALHSETKRRNNYKVGVGSGAQQTIPLTDSNILYNSFSLKVNGVNYSSFFLNTENNEITLKVDKGAEITATYEYDWSIENWQEMMKVSCQKYDDTGKYASVFQYSVPKEYEGRNVASVKFELNRPDGYVQDKILGTATGDAQTFELPHYARADTISCSGTWHYDEDSKTIKVRHDKDEQISISYYWVAESPIVYSLECGWAQSV